MITITKGQSVPKNEGMIVMSESGDYDEHDFIMCGYEGQEPVAQFEAQFIQYGNDCYNIKEK